MDVHISADGEPPTGVVHADHQAAVPFAGWLELMAVLASALEEQPSAGGFDEGARE